MFSRAVVKSTRVAAKAVRVPVMSFSANASGVVYHPMPCHSTPYAQSSDPEADVAQIDRYLLALRSDDYIHMEEFKGLDEQARVAIIKELKNMRRHAGPVVEVETVQSLDWCVSSPPNVHDFVYPPLIMEIEHLDNLSLSDIEPDFDAR